MTADLATCVQESQPSSCQYSRHAYLLLVSRVGDKKNTTQQPTNHRCERRLMDSCSCILHAGDWLPCTLVAKSLLS
ncbi:hypothetical protein E2C01_075528 [Portunus trituberculatus]|uniref:Uncharacterized protein n=1 Tax=Portunus trituberculatus TaxID=210409 RepID=A0A5B7I8T5_PORTR|nr:hypothetical protein [Portunus trituberculatus]